MTSTDRLCASALLVALAHVAVAATACASSPAPMSERSETTDVGCRHPEPVAVGHRVPGYELRTDEAGSGRPGRGGQGTLDKALAEATADSELAARHEARLRARLLASSGTCDDATRSSLAEEAAAMTEARAAAIKQYGALVSKNVAWHRRDEALYLLAREHLHRSDAAAMLGESSEAANAAWSAARIRKSLETEHPDSPWLPLALIDEAAGRHSAGDEFAALELYKRALASPSLSDHVRAFLLYRAAWCHRSLGNAADAERLFDTAAAVAAGRSTEPWSPRLEKAIERERSHAEGAVRPQVGFAP